MIGFTPLETAILKSLADSDPNDGPAIRAFLATARVTRRDNTGHGFYTYFDIDRAASPPLPGERLRTAPNAWMNDIGDEALMGFILWLEDGYPDCLEGYQYGDKDGNTVDLNTYDLAALTFTQLDPPPAP